MTTTTRSTNITDLVVDSKNNCYHLFVERMKEIQDKGVTADLDPGIHVIRLKEGFFDYVENDPERQVGEPIVMLWIYGGEFKNYKTGVKVKAGWSTLNGFDDTVTLEVTQAAKLCAFFFDTDITDNVGAVTVSVVRVDDLPSSK